MFKVFDKTQLISFQNKNFQLHIVGSGIPYGLEEDIFYHWFALGYTNSDLTSLPVVNQGTNLVPTIHINELVKIIGHLVNNPRSVKKAYCIAVDNDSNTLADIVKAVSRLFTKHGAIYHVPLEEFEQTYPKDLVYSLDQKVNMVHWLCRPHSDVLPKLRL